ncbi:hypothetical protein [Salisaeta longa]|uniref:hypothetical protein n=1 Tax=Salisaeta longa TaxID=503170 RepID=UPI0003F52822|nr:hypothetical protein [Salisaeta longa]
MKVVSKSEALRTINRHSRRRSKYSPILDLAEENIDGDSDAVLVEEIEGEPLTSTEVQGIRAYMNRHMEGRYIVRSRSYDTNEAGERLYKVAIFLDPERDS